MAAKSGARSQAIGFAKPEVLEAAASPLFDHQGFMTSKT
jgi:hypothetical protein